MQADMLFTNARVYNVFLKQWNTIEVAVLNGKILYTGDAREAGITSIEVIDCENRPLIPGMIDIHLHIESSLCVPTTFAKAVLPHGVTTVVSEPHEIANVFGLSGVEEMIRVSEGAVIDIFYGVPSSVPSTNKELETTGGTIDTDELEILMRNHPDVICLGEVMNYSAVINSFEETTTANTAKRLKTLELITHMQKNYPLAAVEGHCPSVTDLDLSKLLYAGIGSDHCLQDVEGMHQRFSNGMFVELQEKSITKDIIGYIVEHDVDGLYSLVTDDVPPDILTTKGHLDHVVRQALKQGLSLEQVIIATSYAPAARMNFHDRGVIAPGRIADFILLKDTSDTFSIKAVYKRGVSQERIAKQNLENKEFNRAYTESLILPEDLLDTNKLFSIETTQKTGTILTLIIRKNRKNTYTEAVTRELRQKNNHLLWENQKNLNLVVVIERYTGKGEYSQGLMDGTTIHHGAFCSSYAHDHHNLLIIGDNPQDMKIALQRVIEIQGGMCVVDTGIVTAELQLPIGGILSEEPMEPLASKAIEIQKNLRELGIDHKNPIMSLCTITLPVSPKLKITDRGLIDVEKEKSVKLFLEELNLVETNDKQK